MTDKKLSEQSTTFSERLRSNAVISVIHTQQGVGILRFENGEIKWLISGITHLDLIMSYQSQRVQVKGNNKKRKSASNRADFFCDNLIPLNRKIQTNGDIRPQSDEQKRYIESINKNQVTLVLGNAGCGKTLLGLNQTIKLINNDESSIKKLVYMRILVDCYEENSLGFLTGDKDEKLDPYKRPALDNLQLFMTESESVNIFTFKKAMIDIPEFMEGRSLPNTMLFLDEAQAASPSRINMLIERIDSTSKIIIAGATNQRKNKGQEPLTSLAEIFENNPCPDFGVIRLTQNLRNPTYKKWEQNLNQWMGR